MRLKCEGNCFNLQEDEVEEYFTSLGPILVGKLRCKHCKKNVFYTDDPLTVLEELYSNAGKDS